MQTPADDVATALERLDIEYEQVLAGTDELATSVLAPIDDLRSTLQGTMDRAPWLNSDQRAVVLDQIAHLRQAAVDGVGLPTFVTELAAAADAVRATFGV